MKSFRHKKARRLLRAFCLYSKSIVIHRADKVAIVLARLPGEFKHGIGITIHINLYRQLGAINMNKVEAGT
jgi:hypothetical protein